MTGIISRIACLHGKRFSYLPFVLFMIIDSVTAQKVAILSGPKPETWESNYKNRQLVCIAIPVTGVTIDWIKDGETIHEDEHISITRGDKGGRYVSTLIFRHIKKSDEGLYTCKASNPVSSVTSNPAYIRILGPPSVNIGNPLPESLYVNWHDAINLQCDGSGPPSITEVKWIYNAFIKGIDQLSIAFSGEIIRHLRDPALRILPREDDAMMRRVVKYEVFCTVKNSRGSKNSKTTTIFIKQRPGIPVVDHVISLDKGQAVRLYWQPVTDKSDPVTCTAFFYGAHQFAKTLRQPVSLGLNNEVIDGMHPATSYSVSIQCRNSVGLSELSDRYPFTTKEGIPETPPYVNVTALNSTSFRISWGALSPDKVHGTLSGYKIKWKQFKGSEKTETVSPDTLKADFYGLVPGQRYGASVFGFTQTKDGPVSDMKYVLLPLFDDVSRPLINVSDILSKEATFTVRDTNMKEGALNNCSIILSDLIHDITVKVDVSLQPFSQDVQSLIPNTEYSFILVCNTYDNKQLRSDRKSFMTREGKPSHSPDSLTLKSVNSSIVATWAPVVQDLNGYFAGYNVCIIAAAQDQNDARKCYNATTPSFYFEQVEPQSTYTVVVSACTKAGCGPTKYGVHTTDDWEVPNIGTQVPYPTSVAGGTIKYVYIGIALLVVVIIIISIVLVCRKRVKKPTQDNNLTVEFSAVNNEQQYEQPLLRPIWTETNTYSDIPALQYPTLSKDTISKLEDVKYDCERVTLEEVIGKGEFGRVYKGTFAPSGGQSRTIGQPIEVAIKTMIMHDYDKTEYEEFVKEGLRMKDMDHPNVMRLIGICLPVESNTNTNNLKLDSSASGYESISPWVIVPYMPNGDLKQYLYNARMENEAHKIGVHKLLRFAYNIACGMEYLSAKHIVHRDLACRNCMLDANMNVVVSDFGLSRQIYSSSYYVQRHAAKMPVKWMAIESLMDRVYTSMTDVWAFGVTLWEIFTFCQSPFPGVDNSEMLELLKAGTRLKQPGHCPNDVWNDGIYPCWDDRPDERPSFTELAEKFARYKKLHPESSNDNLYVNVLPIDGYEKLVSKPRTNTVSSELNEVPMPYESAVVRLPSGKVVPKRSRGSSKKPLLSRDSVHSDNGSEEVVQL